MRSFKEWQNAKKYLEFMQNPIAPPIPMQTNPSDRGVQPVSNPATANPANPTAPTSNQQTIDPALQSKFTRITKTFETLPAQQQARLLSLIDDHVAKSLAQDGKSSLFRNVAQGNVRGGRQMLSQGVKGFINPTASPSTN